MEDLIFVTLVRVISLFIFICVLAIIARVWFFFFVFVVVVWLFLGIFFFSWVFGLKAVSSDDAAEEEKEGGGIGWPIAGDAGGFFKAIEEAGFAGGEDGRKREAVEEVEDDFKVAGFLDDGFGSVKDGDHGDRLLYTSPSPRD